MIPLRCNPDVLYLLFPVVLFATQLRFLGKVRDSGECYLAFQVDRSVPFLHKFFLTRPFVPALLSLLSGPGVDPYFRRKVYEYIVRFRFPELLTNYQSIPPFQGLFDLMRFIPIDGTGCPRSFFPDLLDNASVVPERPVRQHKVLCASLS
jgi:hypothetical protein